MTENNIFNVETRERLLSVDIDRRTLYSGGYNAQFPGARSVVRGPGLHTLVVGHLEPP